MTTACPRTITVRRLVQDGWSALPSCPVLGTRMRAPCGDLHLVEANGNVIALHVAPEPAPSWSERMRQHTRLAHAHLRARALGWTVRPSTSGAFSEVQA